MTFSELRTALFRRGFEDLNDAGAGLVEAKRHVNAAYGEVCSEERWPFLLTTATGAAPLTITDIGSVESVRDTGQNSVRLAWRDRRDLTSSYGDLTTTGSPRWFYIENGVIRTWPVGGTLSVLYYKTPAELSADGDTPLVPSRFQDVIVVGAARKAHAARSNYEAAANEQAEYDRLLNLMRSDLLDQQDDSSDTISVVAGSQDW